MRFHLRSLFFFFNDTATTEIYTLSLHDALPISLLLGVGDGLIPGPGVVPGRGDDLQIGGQRGQPGLEADLVVARSEEHTSELQSRLHLVCRLLLEKKKKYKN